MWFSKVITCIKWGHSRLSTRPEYLAVRVSTGDVHITRGLAYESLKLHPQKKVTLAGTQLRLIVVFLTNVIAIRGCIRNIQNAVGLVWHPDFYITFFTFFIFLFFLIFVFNTNWLLFVCKLAQTLHSCSCDKLHWHCPMEMCYLQCFIPTVVY